MAGGGHYSHQGSGANYVCLPLDPDYEELTHAPSSKAYMYGAEYEHLGKLCLYIATVEEEEEGGGGVKGEELEKEDEGGMGGGGERGCMYGTEYDSLSKLYLYVATNVKTKVVINIFWATWLKYA